MQTDLLLDQFDTLLTIPDDVAHLEAAVLQLAVQGKLVPQDPDDEPATELLKHIRAEQERLVREGEISKPRDIPPIDPDEVPFALPEGWVWSRLGESTVIVLGQSPPSTTYNSVGEGLPFYQGKKDFGETYPTPTQWCSEPKKIAEKDDVLISVRAPVGPTNLCQEKSCIGRGLAAIRSLAGVSSFYLLYMMRAFEAELSGKGFGTTFTAITGKDLRRFLVPLPPLAEQKRIVAKVDELLAQTRALAAQLQQADVSLVPAAQAAFQSLLAAQDTTAQHEAWQRIADHFDTLTRDPRTIEALKQTVLQLAVQGKLVPQDPEDEPASVLIERIEAEKARLVQEGRIRKKKRLRSVEADEIPHELPERWKWCRLAQVALDIHYGYTASADFSLRDFRLLRITDIQNNTVDWPSVPGCTIDRDKASKYLLGDGDILIARTGGTIGKSYLVQDLALKSVFASYLIRIIPSREVDARYLKLFLESPLYWEQLTQRSMGTGQPNVNATSLSQLALPLSPLAEQKRIVAKVEALLALCDALAAEVAAAEEVRGRLLGAVLDGG